MDILLKYDRKTGEWGECEDPFVTIHIKSVQDFVLILDVVSKIGDSTAYITEKRCCSACGRGVAAQTGLEPNKANYCWHCGRKFIEKDKEE